MTDHNIAYPTTEDLAVHRARWNATYRERLEALVRFLEKLPPERFNFSAFVTSDGQSLCQLTSMKKRKAAVKDCGTTCCAAGWLPSVFPRDWHWVDCSDNWDTKVIGVRLRDLSEDDEVWEHLAEFFDITEDLACFLFGAQQASFWGAVADREISIRDIEISHVITVMRLLLASPGRLPQLSGDLVANGFLSRWYAWGDSATKRILVNKLGHHYAPSA